MSLNLNIVDLEPVAPKEPLYFHVVREATEADIELALTQPAGETPPELKRITDRHHMLARLLASGMTEEEASVHTGYSLSRISILKNSPAFVELQELYRDKASENFYSLYEHMGGLSKDALALLRERVEENPDRMTTTELLKIIETMSDRAADNPTDRIMPTVIELVAPDVGSSLPGAGDEEGEAD